MALNDTEVESLLRTSWKQLNQHQLSGLHEQIIESLDDFPPDLQRFGDYNTAERRLIAYLYNLHDVIRSIDSGTASTALAALGNYTGRELTLDNAILHWGDENETTITFRELLPDCSEALAEIRNLIEQLGLPPPDNDGNDNQPPEDGGGGGSDDPSNPPFEPTPGLVAFLARMAQHDQHTKLREEEEEYVQTKEQQFIQITRQ